MLSVLPIFFLDGYGFSMRDCSLEETPDDMLVRLPDKLKRGLLTFIYQDDPEMLIPAIRIGKEVTICIGFYIWLEKYGWRRVLLEHLPKSLDDLSKGLTIRTEPATLDMDGYEKVDPFKGTEAYVPRFEEEADDDD